MFIRHMGTYAIPLLDVDYGNGRRLGYLRGTSRKARSPNDQDQHGAIFTDPPLAKISMVCRASMNHPKPLTRPPLPLDNRNL